MSIYPTTAQSNIMVTYTNDKEGPVSILLYDSRGHLMQTILQNENKAKGKHRQEIYFSNEIAPGNYWVNIKTSSLTSGQKITKA